MTMPRPNRAHGRPGTRMVPLHFERDHGAVIAKTRLVTTTITAPSSGTVKDEDLGYRVPAPGATIYTGTARVQQLSTQEAHDLVGGQDQVTTAYLVVIDRTANEIPLGAVIALSGDHADPDLTGASRLTVVKVGRGGPRFERDLYCVEDQSRPPAA